MTSVFTAEDRKRIDDFHFAGRDGGASGAGGYQYEIYCGAPGCGARLQRGEAPACGRCRCTYYCNAECQREGWKAGGHQAACKLLAAARALPPANPDRSYVVQLKLLGARGLRAWAADLEAAGDDGGLAAMHRDMASVLKPRERALLALEARHHAMLRFMIVPPSKQLQPSDLALFALRAITHPMSDLPTLNMSAAAPLRPYALWLPGTGPDRPMAEPVGRLVAGAGLATSAWYVGAGFCAESRLGAGGAGVGSDELALDLRAELDPDYYTEDDSDGAEGEGGEGGDGDEGAGAGAASAAGSAAGVAGAGAGAPGRLRCLVVAGLHMFGPAGEADDPLLGPVAGALRAAGAELVIAMFPRRKQAAAQKAAEQELAAQLRDGGFAACVVLGLGSGDDFTPRTPTRPWSNGGAWKEGLGDWVRAGGVLVMHGERAAAATARAYFGLSWTMEGDHYRRTDHVLNAGCPLLAGGGLAARLPRQYNVKACMLGDVPPPQRLYATPADARAYSLVPSMAGGPVDEGRCAMAAAAVGGGAVVFFGDVNWEEPTLAAVTALVKQLAAERAAGGR